MVKNRIIGGEFEIGVDLFHSAEYATEMLPYTTYSSGRAALYNILQQIVIGGNKCLLIPDYLCESVISVIMSSGWQFKVYPLNDNFEPNLDELKKIYSGKEAILVVNYFGLIDCKKVIVELRNVDEYITIVQDNVQAPYAMRQSLEADYAFTSFRKSFPSPDGACAYSKHGVLFEPVEESLFSQYKIAGTILKGLGYHNSEFDNIYLSLLGKGEELIDENFQTDMSTLSKRILNALDWDRIRFIRRRNATQIINGLKELKIEPLIPMDNTCVPLFIPISIPHRDIVRKALFANNIFAPIHWPVGNKSYQLKRGENLAQTELSLIVDQRYNSTDMQDILRVIERNI